MSEIHSVIEVHFNCRECGTKINVRFGHEQISGIRCPSCESGYTLLKPTIGDEILFDWETEAMGQKARADKTEQDKTELMALIIKVVELLTWRDEGNGHIRAIETLRQWLLLNGVPKPLIELLDAKGPEGSSPTEYRK